MPKKRKKPVVRAWCEIPVRDYPVDTFVYADGFMFKLRDDGHWTHALFPICVDVTELPAREARRLNAQRIKAMKGGGA